MANDIKEKIVVGLSVFVLLAILTSIYYNNNTLTGKAIFEPKEQVFVRSPIPIVDAAFSPWYAAIDKDFYDGLDITLRPGSPQANPIKMVLSGADQFGIIGGPDTLLVARSKGLPLVAIATIHRNSNFPVILTLEDSNLTNVKDLQNKKIGFFYGHISTDVLRNLFRKEKITVQEVDVGFDYNQLITKKIDAQWAFRTTAGLNLPAKGIKVNTISPADYGITTHGLTIFTTEKMIKENPELVRKFLLGTIKGIGYTVNNPEMAVTHTLNRNPSLDYDLELKRLKLDNEVTSKTRTYPPGYMDEKMFQETYDRLLQEGVLENKFDVTKAFTTQFLDEIYP